MFTYRNQTVSGRRDQLLDSWRKFAPDLTLAGMTLTQFETEGQEPDEVRQRLSAAKTEVAGVIIEREQADDRLRLKMRGLVNALRGDPAYGEDCAFYRSLGYIPTSERKRPVRTPKTPPVVAAPVINVA